MRLFLIVFRREFLLRFKKPSFFITTLFSIALMSAMTLLPQLGSVLNDSSGSVPRVALSCSDAAICAQVRVPLEADWFRVRLADAKGREDAKLSITGRGVDFSARLEEFSSVPASSEGAIREALLDARARVGEARGEKDPVNIAIVRSSRGAAGQKQNALPRELAVSIIVLTYLAITTYGMLIAGSVVEEKNTKTLDILLSAVRPIYLLLGKLFGVGALGLVQLCLILAGVSAVLSTAFSFDPGLAKALHTTQPGSLGISTLLPYLWMFLLGFFSYAGLFTAFGAVIPDGERMRQYAAVLYLPLYAAFYLAMTIGNNVDALHRWLSILPLFGPMIMSGRLALGNVGIGDVFGCALSSILFIVVATAIAARLYSAPTLLQIAPRTFVRGAD